MSRFINLYLIEYALNSLLRQKSKSIFIGIVFSMLVFLLSSVFFITSSIKYELDSTLSSLPQIIVQNIKAGRVYDIQSDKLDAILSINGVEDATARVWGYYYFEQLGVNFSLVGIEQYERQYKNSFENITKKFNLDSDTPSMVVGTGVLKSMKKAYYNEYFNFIKPDGSIKKVSIAGVFDGDTNLESNDVIVMSNDTLREIFDIPEDMATDIVVKVLNEDEITTIANKIKLIYPSFNIITNEDLRVSYQNMFNYKGGIFLALFIISLFTFFIIVYDKASGITSEEKREIGILKALGWRIEDVLKEKFYESFILSFISYIIGINLAIFFVYILQAPLLRDIFIGYSDIKPAFELSFIFDLATMILVFFLSVPIYIASTIIPSWRVATLDADEVIR
jgi:ABC-type lipoprotein release transport system permease subunit